MTKQPDILLIMPDQWRGDCLSLERHPVLLTPNIDEIGGRGTHFRRAYVTCPSCIAARRSLLTGQFPATNGVVGFVGGIPIKSPTLPQLLRDAGYRTALAGRHMHQSPYTRSYGYQTQVLGSNYVDNDDHARWLEKHAPDSGGVKGHGISFNGWTAKPWQLADHLHLTNWTVQRSREIIRKQSGKQPLFLTASFMAPHPPFIPPAFYYERYRRMELPPVAIGDWAVPPANDGRGCGVDRNRVVLRGEALRSAQAGYFGLINHIDDQLYWLIAEFRERARARRRPWLIVFTSDHGEMLGDHYYFRKCEPYEGSARIPFLIQGTGDLGFKPGQTCDQPVCLEDLLPTLLEFADVPIPSGVDGRSLVPVLQGGKEKIRDWLHGEHSPGYSQEQAHHYLTDGRMKYIWRPATGAEQLFDLVKDPRELRDLAKRRRPELRRWRARLIERLRGRAEGFTDGKRLITGRPYPGIC
ncbi:MAG: sulfatase-like hydrolase/transferase [Verrucomicrobiota bacterium]|jgi:arylsulfatase